MSKKLFFLMSLLILTALVLTACGESGPSSSLRVDMTDFIYSPADYTVPAGETVTLELINSGAVEHEFAIMNFGTEVGDNFGDEDEINIYWEAELGPGRSETFTFVAPEEPGEYQIVCGIEGHFLAGMVGSMIVVSP